MSTSGTVQPIVLGLLQVISFLGALASLLVSGFSAWTLLVGLVATGVTKISLAQMDYPPGFDDDEDAVDAALLLIEGKGSHSRRSKTPCVVNTAPPVRE